MHSSRMRTVRTLTVSPIFLCSGQEGGSTWSRGGVPGPGGYLVTGGGGVPGLGGYLVRGVYLVPGVYLVLGGVPGPGGVYLVLGGVPGPRGWVPGPGWVPGHRGGCTWSRGGCTWSRGCTWSGTPPCGQTHACKNITFATSLRTVMT